MRVKDNGVLVDKALQMLQNFYLKWWKPDLTKYNDGRLVTIARALVSRLARGQSGDPDDYALYVRWGRHDWHEGQNRRSWEHDVDFLWHKRIDNKYLCFYLVPLQNLELVVSSDGENAYKEGDIERMQEFIEEAES